MSAIRSRPEMAAEIKKEIELEIAHVLVVDIVGYSKLLIHEQRDLLESLNQIVRNAPQFRSAETGDRLVKIATGDGMALVFYNTPEAPAECALEISRSLKEHPQLRVRMGVHSGPVSGVLDLNERANVAGAGINIAQRIMDCGDAGHILLSKRVAEDLQHYARWQPHLHPLGECEVKHGVRISVVNLYTEDLGNPEVPGKFKRSGARPALSAATKTFNRRKYLFITGVVVAALALSFLLFRMIETDRGPVRRAPAEAGQRSAASAQLSEKSIAVLPFANLSNDQQNAYFADGMQDEILTNLAKIADLKVISRTSVMQYRSGAARNLRQIASELGVAHLLEGSVQRASGKVRVNAQLIDARTDTHLWASSYDRDLADVFAIQSEIAKAIADQLHAKLSPSETSAIEKPPTSDLAAYELYLRAQALYADTSDQLRAAEKLPQAVHLLEQAVARDPRFLLGWCRLSKVHGLIYWQGHDHTPARLDLANTAVQSALRLQRDAGEAHLALADYYYHGFRDYARALAELAVARRTLPNNAEVFEYTAYIDRRQGRWKEATHNLEKALELDPRNFFILQQLALIYEAQRRYEDQIQTYGRALTITPGDPATQIYRAAVELEWRGDIKPFQTTLAALIAENPSVASDVDDPRYALCERKISSMERALTNYPRDGVVTNGIKYPHAYWEGVARFCQGDSVKARVAFTAARREVATIVEQQPESAAALSLLGLIDAGLGQKEDALHEGRHACELLPITKDAIDGAAFAVNLAQIYAWTGEKNLAIEQIVAVERVPNYLSYGLLKLLPYWDSLRGEPRFEKILASLAPKEKS